jgi:hypothetical protein
LVSGVLAESSLGFWPFDRLILCPPRWGGRELAPPRSGCASAPRSATAGVGARRAPRPWSSRQNARSAASRSSSPPVLTRPGALRTLRGRRVAAAWLSATRSHACGRVNFRAPDRLFLTRCSHLQDSLRQRRIPIRSPPPRSDRQREDARMRDHPTVNPTRAGLGHLEVPPPMKARSQRRPRAGLPPLACLAHPVSVGAIASRPFGVATPHISVRRARPHTVSWAASPRGQHGVTGSS